jgi:predicted DNA-binding protein YlxM (UPF0122 family)
LSFYGGKKELYLGYLELYLAAIDLVLAVRNGYYSIPRQVSTQELADTLEISDQAVTERLRRAIETLVENTIIAMEAEETEEFTAPKK